ncbi:DUF3253 domain-containing protein [Pseudochryseolinea flava]|uniref:DUF3253 domain-containing protein n=1 Tax=Pseudochryseolinea flava TaxID=2059302 RepID=A0A364Y853_9BACT|nr:DUF3253 domain-containing protein [Pseudochryseolinea flava]RAW03296.1 hypothetical protein DQQ10_04220 [Pseudochryseolinea flava]
MVFAEEIRKTILRLAEETGKERSFAPADVARAIDQQNWPLLIDQVKLVAETLIKEGKIKITGIKNQAESHDGPRFKGID